MAFADRSEDFRDDLVEAGLGEQRKAMRFALLIRSAKIVSDLGEFLCVIRDVSEDGVKLRLFHPLPMEGPVQLELSTGDRFAIERAWHDEKAAGFKFVDPIDLPRFLSETSPFPKRPVRLRISRPATIRADGRICDVEIRDLSREGISIDTHFPLALEQQVTLQADNLSPRAASVRWRRSPSYGLALQHVLSFEELAITAARMQLPAHLVAAAGTEREIQLRA